jgi:3-deoxy-D-manno-octulosonic-acid transferase
MTEGAHARGLRPLHATATGVSPALQLYLGASRIAGPAVRWWLARRAARGREDPARLGERLGQPSLARPPGLLIWLHGASIGETAALLPLVAELRRQEPAAACLVTAGTVGAARLLSGTLPQGCLHQYAPVDTGAAVRRFLAHWRPDLAIWAESELWPRLLAGTAARGIPMLLVGARISARSARRWAWAPGMIRRLLGHFARIEAQDGEAAARLLALGARPLSVRAGGNLKAAVPAPPCTAEALGRARAALRGRPVWLAASTHAPEEAIVAEAHRLAAQAVPGLLAILAPRHPERSAAVAAVLRRRGHTVARRSAGELPGPDTDIWLADTLGEMGLWLRLAPVAFIGGSLARAGGHTPFEAAALAELLPSARARATMAEAAAAVRARLAPDLPALAARALALMETGR